MPVIASRKLGRPFQHRILMLKTMVTQLIYNERIQTTLARARELRRMADKVVTMAKKGTPQAHAKAQGYVKTDRELHKLLTTLAQRYRDRPGGYTRIIKSGRRQHDAAKMAFVEFVDREGELREARPPPPFAPPRRAYQPYSMYPLSAQAYLLRQRHGQQQQQPSPPPPPQQPPPAQPQQQQQGGRR